MLCVAYESLAGHGGLVALQLRDIDFHPNGTGRALIRRGKTDAMRQGRIANLSSTTVRWLKVWLEHAGVEEGAIFRRLIGHGQIGGALNSGSVALIFKRVAQRIGMPVPYVALDCKLYQLIARLFSCYFLDTETTGHRGNIQFLPVATSLVFSRLDCAIR